MVQLSGFYIKSDLLFYKNYLKIQTLQTKRPWQNSTLNDINLKSHNYKAKRNYNAKQRNYNEKLLAVLDLESHQNERNRTDSSQVSIFSHTLVRPLIVTFCDFLSNF